MVVIQTASEYTHSNLDPTVPAHEQQQDVSQSGTDAAAVHDNSHAHAMEAVMQLAQAASQQQYDHQSAAEHHDEQQHEQHGHIENPEVHHDSLPSTMRKMPPRKRGVRSDDRPMARVLLQAEGGAKQQGNPNRMWLQPPPLLPPPQLLPTETSTISLFPNLGPKQHSSRNSESVSAASCVYRCLFRFHPEHFFHFCRGTYRCFCIRL